MKRALPCLVVLFAMVSPAAAQGLVKVPKRPAAWSFALRAGPYRPAPKDGPIGQTYDLSFKSGQKGALFDHGPLLKAIDVDYFFYDLVGRLGIVASVGHWKIDGNALLCSDGTRSYACRSPDGKKVDIGEEGIEVSAGNTPQSLTLIPLRLGGVYRFEWLARELGIPFVIYARAGMDYALWWIRANGKVTRVKNDKGKKERGQGGTLGVFGGGGLSLYLDWIDPSVGTGTSASTTGFLGSYLFIEATYIYSNVLGEEGRLDPTGLVVSMGLALDFL